MAITCCVASAPHIAILRSLAASAGSSSVAGHNFGSAVIMWRAPRRHLSIEARHQRVPWATLLAVTSVCQEWLDSVACSATESF